MLRASLTKPRVSSLRARKLHSSKTLRDALSSGQPSSSRSRDEPEQKSASSTSSVSSDSPESIDISHSNTASPSSSPSSLSYSTSTSSSSSSSSPSSSGHNPTDEPPKTPLGVFKEKVLDWTNDRVFQFRRKADDFTGTTKARLSGLGAELNKVTGYEEIEALKHQVREQEARIEQSRQAARSAKHEHETAVLLRSKSQREVNDLLQRKSTWTDDDVLRFTSLVREDHLFEQNEARSKVAADEAEAAVEKEFTELMRVILARYHEEQVWSDKIRSASTYGQLAALGLNLFVFVMAIILVEPWKRRRLAQTFEKKIEEMGKEYKQTLGDNVQLLQKQLEGQAAVIAAMTVAVGKLDVQAQRSEEVVALEEEDEPVMTSGIWTKAVKDRNFGEAVAMGALAASVISAIGWIWLGG